VGLLCFLDTTMVYAAPTGQVCYDEWYVLQILVERTKGSKSPFLPYLQSLPQGVGGLPMFYQPDEVAALQYPPLIQQINLRCRWLLRFSGEQMTPQVSAQLFNYTGVDVNLLGGTFSLPAVWPCSNPCVFSGFGEGGGRRASMEVSRCDSWLQWTPG